jgi:hypothetical protein
VYCLCTQAVRHGMDPQCPSILREKVIITTYNNKVALLVKHMGKSSMKAESYNVTLSLTTAEMIACSCLCKAGSVGIDQVMFVHILPVLFSLSQLLLDGLAGHLLGELASVYSHEDNKLLVKEHQTILLRSLLNLDLATSNCMTTCKDTSNITAFDALQEFLVGTEKEKFGPGPPSSIAELGTWTILYC